MLNPHSQQRRIPITSLYHAISVPNLVKNILSFSPVYLWLKPGVVCSGRLYFLATFNVIHNEVQREKRALSGHLLLCHQPPSRRAAIRTARTSCGSEAELDQEGACAGLNRRASAVFPAPRLNALDPFSHLSDPGRTGEGTASEIPVSSVHLAVRN